MAREFTVYPVLNGWVVKIGCWMIAYVDRAVLHSDMFECLTDPDKKEKEMVARYNPDRIFPEIMGVSGLGKIAERPTPVMANDCGGGIEKELRR
jgi:hypothetical protein